MEITFNRYREIQEYIKANFEKTAELDYTEAEVLALLEKPYVPDKQFDIPESLILNRSLKKAPKIHADVKYSIPDQDECELKIASSMSSPYLTGLSFDDEIQVKEIFDSLEQDKRIKAIAEELRQRDESFRDMLFRKIDELGITDAECYKRAQLTRSHFNKIKNDKAYNPKKTTVVALGMALELPMDEFVDFVSKAGYSLSKNNAFDLIIRYTINEEEYDILELNHILFYFDQQLLGAGCRE